MGRSLSPSTHWLNTHFLLPLPPPTPIVHHPLTVIISICNATSCSIYVVSSGPQCPPFYNYSHNHLSPPLLHHHLSPVVVAVDFFSLICCLFLMKHLIINIINGWNTVVSAYIPPGYKPTSASVPFKEFPDCFCYPLHSKASLFSPTGCKHKPASVLPNCPPKHAKNPVVSRLLKIIW